MEPSTLSDAFYKTKRILPNRLLLSTLSDAFSKCCIFYQYEIAAKKTPAFDIVDSALDCNLFVLV